MSSARKRDSSRSARVFPRRRTKCRKRGNAANTVAMVAAAASREVPNFSARPAFPWP